MHARPLHFPAGGISVVVWRARRRRSRPRGRLLSIAAGAASASAFAPNRIPLKRSGAVGQQPQRRPGGPSGSRCWPSSLALAELAHGVGAPLARVWVTRMVYARASSKNYAGAATTVATTPRRPRPGLRPVQGRLRARHLRQHEDAGRDDLRRQATPLQASSSRYNRNR